MSHIRLSDLQDESRREATITKIGGCLFADSEQVRRGRLRALAEMPAAADVARAARWYRDVGMALIAGTVACLLANLAKGVRVTEDGEVLPIMRFLV